MRLISWTLRSGSEQPPCRHPLRRHPPRRHHLRCHHLRHHHLHRHPLRLTLRSSRPRRSRRAHLSRPSHLCRLQLSPQHRHHRCHRQPGDITNCCIPVVPPFSPYFPSSPFHVICHICLRNSHSINYRQCPNCYRSNGGTNYQGW